MAVARARIADRQTDSTDCIILSVTIIGVGTGGPGGLGPLTFLFEGAQYDRGPLTFEKCRPIFDLKVTPYFQS